MGGFLLWVELPSDLDTDRLQIIALDRGISIAPGSIFSAQGDFRTCLRIHCGYPWFSTFDEAIQKFGNLTQQDIAT
jgi:DNA-binding transcriptional MocR family regulator